MHRRRGHHRQADADGEANQDNDIKRQGHELRPVVPVKAYGGHGGMVHLSPEKIVVDPAGSGRRINLWTGGYGATHATYSDGCPYLTGLAAASTQAASPQGDWSRGDGKAKVRIAPCGEDICAVNTWIKPGIRDEKAGDRLVMTITDQGGGEWTGKAYDPQRNLHYHLKMQVADKSMTTTGCVLGGLICKGVAWTRIEG